MGPGLDCDTRHVFPSVEQALNPSRKWLVMLATFVPLLYPQAYLAALVIIAVQTS